MYNSEKNSFALVQDDGWYFRLPDDVLEYENERCWRKSLDFLLDKYYDSRRELRPEQINVEIEIF